eukprot:2712372-Rhodomonas_salina.3
MEQHKIQTSSQLGLRRAVASLAASCFPFPTVVLEKEVLDKICCDLVDFKAVQPRASEREGSATSLRITGIESWKLKRKRNRGQDAGRRRRLRRTLQSVEPRQVTCSSLCARRAHTCRAHPQGRVSVHLRGFPYTMGLLLSSNLALLPEPSRFLVVIRRKAPALRTDVINFEYIATATRTVRHYCLIARTSRSKRVIGGRQVGKETQTV